MATRVLLLALLLAAGASAEEIKLQQVDRKINLNSQFARVTEVIKLKNLASKPIDRVVVCQALVGKAVVAHIKVSQVQDSTKTKLKLASVTPAGVPQGVSCWEATLAKALPKGDVATLESLAVLADAQQAYPAEIKQGEQQLMLYLDNLYTVSPYSVSAQTTEVLLPTSNVKSYTDAHKPVSKSDNKVTFGKYDLIKPFTLEQLRVHFENNKPFRKALSLAREIEVSHWGNIYVEEQYELKNSGSKHAGVFSRLRYAHSFDGKGNAFQDLKAKLPQSAHSLYYVDIIGNISTSNVRKTKTETILDFSTRYPLLGGWKVDFKLGYSVPLTGFLGKLRSGKRRLTIDFSTPIEGVYVEDLVVKVVLPEGASDITYSLPFDVEASRSVKYTYLDVSGRPVLVLRKAHVVPEHATKLTVDYSFPAFGEAREPLLLVAAFAVLFVLVILYNRLEFTIARDEKWQAGQDAEKVATVMQAINSLLDEQDEVVETTLRLAGSIADARDADSVQADKAGAESTFTSFENKIKSLVAGVASVQPRTADKVRELQDKARSLQQRAVKLLADRSDLVKKGSSGNEATKKLQPALQSLQEARTEFAAAVQAVFAPY